MSFGVKTGREKGTKWASGLPGKNDGRGLRVWKVSGQGRGWTSHVLLLWLGSGVGSRARSGRQRATRGCCGSDQRVVELATLERLLVVGPGRGGHAAVGVE